MACVSAFWATNPCVPIRGGDRHAVRSGLDRMIALCQFPLADNSAAEILDAARTHQFVVSRRNGDWEIIETPEIKLTKAEIAKLNQKCVPQGISPMRLIPCAVRHLSDGTAVCFGQDITWRKRAEEDLRESEERLRQLAETIRHLFWIKTPDMKRAIYYSPRYDSISGRSREEAYRDGDYQFFLNTIVPEDWERVAEFLQRGVEADFEIEYRTTHPDGSVHWICDHGYPIRDSSGQIYRVTGLAQDITEHKLAEEALRESEERFRQIAENIRDVFWLRSPDLKQLLYVSPMYEKVFGWSCERLYADGENLSAVHPEDRSRVLHSMQTCGGREFEIEYRIIKQDREVRWIRDRGFPIRDQSGNIYRIGGVAEDITDRKEAEERLKTSSEQLRALSASLQSTREKEATRIARQIHDELGGPLAGLRWELEALEKMIHHTADPERMKIMHEKLAAMVD
jgi:PAS domain S-box-containing protein